MAQPRKELFGVVRPWLAPPGWTPERILAFNVALDAAGVPDDDRAPAAPPIPTTTFLADPGAFFRYLKGTEVLGPVLTQDEVDGCNAIIEACGEDGWPLADTAYALATAYHETAGTMKPVKEYGGPGYYTRMYDITGNRPAKARELGNLDPGDGAKYAGRGYPQLTGKRNYKAANDKLHARGLLTPEEDLVLNPDLAMRPDIAALIMVYGMREGWFTGRDLDDDLPREGPATLEQFIRSRDIINGTDKQQKIANEAMIFQEALKQGQWRKSA